MTSVNLLQSLVAFGILLFTSNGSGWATNQTITANPNLTFTASSLTVNAGDTVTFTNAGGFHNAVVDMGSGTLRARKRVVLTFSAKAMLLSTDPVGNNREAIRESWRPVLADFCR